MCRAVTGHRRVHCARLVTWCNNVHRPTASLHIHKREIGSVLCHTLYVYEFSSQFWRFFYYYVVRRFNVLKNSLGKSNDVY